MNIKYPVKLNMAPMYLAKSSRIELTFTQKNGRYERFIGNPDNGNLAFIAKLVEDANNASTIQADYERLGAKIDAMVEARVAERERVHNITTAQLRERIKTLESDAFVDAKTRQALRNSSDELTKYSAQLRRDNKALAGRVNGLLEERDSIVAANNSYSKELESLRKIIKLFKHTVGEQRQHLRRLRAKLVKRALKTGELQAALAERREACNNMAINYTLMQKQLKDIRRYMHEQGWKLPAEPRSTHMPFSDKMFEEAAKQPASNFNGVPSSIHSGPSADGKIWVIGSGQSVVAKYTEDKSKIDSFYRELGDLLVKSFGLPKYPFPKKGE